MIIMIGTLAVLAFVILAYQTFWVKRSYYEIGKKSKESFTVVQLSDIHGRTHYINGSLSSIVNSINPDCVMITGDLASKENQLNGVLKEIENINCPNLLFVPGNYERETVDGFRKRMYSEAAFKSIMKSLQNRNISVLLNKGCKLEINNNNILVYGFDNSIYGNERLTLSKEDMQSYDYVILLAHSPSILTLVQELQLPFDLLLAGHTHGGQVRLLNHTAGAYKHCHVGLKQLDQRRNFFINRGLGTVKLPIRVACFPEIAVFKIGA